MIMKGKDMEQKAVEDVAALMCAAARTARTIPSAVISGPDGILHTSCWPVARSLMLVPPTSITSVFMASHRVSTKSRGTSCS